MMMMILLLSLLFPLFSFLSKNQPSHKIREMRKEEKTCFLATLPLFFSLGFFSSDREIETRGRVQGTARSFPTQNAVIKFVLYFVDVYTNVWTALFSFFLFLLLEQQSTESMADFLTTQNQTTTKKCPHGRLFRVCVCVCRLAMLSSTRVEDEEEGTE